jgi:uncharacterized integral membrane protein
MSSDDNVNYKQQLNQVVYKLKHAQPKYWLVAGGILLLVILILVAISMMRSSPNVQFAESFCCGADEDVKKKKKNLK